MSKNYILHIAESKLIYHQQRAKIPYEEKFKIILALQKINFEMRTNNKFKDKSNFKYRVWHPQDYEMEENIDDVQ